MADLESLRASPLFACLEDAQLAELAQQLELERKGFGEVVFEEGDPGDAFYLVHSGKVRVVKKREDGRELTLATLGAGEPFGEGALLGDSRRGATVRASAETTLLVLAREAFDALLAAQPDVRAALLRYVETRGLQNFLRLATGVGQAAKAKDLQRLFAELRVRAFEAGGPFDPATAQALYVVQSGAVELVDQQGAVVETVPPGQTCGEEVALDERSLGLRCRARPGSVLLELPVGAVRPILIRSERLREQLGARVGRRRATLAFPPPSASRSPAPVDPTLPGSLSSLLVEAKARRREQEAAAPLGKPPAARRFRRFPFVERQEQVDCAAACLSMVLLHYGKHISVARLRELTNGNFYGASMASLIDAAEGLGFRCQGLKLPLTILDQQPLPAIAHWEGLHYVVVYALDATHVWVSDPALGRRKLTREAFERGWTGNLVTLEPTPALNAVEASKPYWRPFLAHLRGRHAALLEVFLASVGLQLLALATPLFTQQIVDKVVVGTSTSLLNALAGAMGVLILANVFLGVARSYVVGHLSMRLSHAMLRDLVRHLFSLPLRFFHTKRPGDILNRFEDSEHIRNLLTAKPIQLVMDLVLLVAYAAVLVLYSLWLTGVALALMVPVFLLTLIAAPIMARYQRYLMAASGRTMSALIESFEGAEAVKSTGAERWARTRWEGHFAKEENLSYAAGIIGAVFETLGSVVDKIAQFVILWLGVTLVIDGEMTLGQLMAFQLIVMRMFVPIRTLIGLFDDHHRAAVSAERLGEVLEVAPEGAPSARVAGTRLRGHVTFERVFFRYGGSETPLVLKNLSFELAPGRRLAVVGRSGSGKTTLGRLLLGLYPPSDGRILVDGVDIREIEPATLRRNVATVLQDGALFQGTLSEAIAAGEAWPDPAGVREAGRIAQVDEFARALPQGYDTDIQENGARLSGGQRQRLRIARAIYRDPSVLIFDEATSALDVPTEAQVQRELTEFLSTRASIWIAHRMSTVRTADHILVLEDGEIREQGDHAALMAQRGIYYGLCSQQIDL